MTIQEQIRIAIAFLCICVIIQSERTQAAIVGLTPIVDAFVTDDNGDGIFDSVTDSAVNNMPVQRFTGVREDRSIFEFDISAIPNNAIITEARFQYRAVASGGVPFDVSVEGYTGDGLVTIADATAAATQLASYDANVFGLGPVDVVLSTAFLQSQIGQANPVGLRLQAEIDGVGTAVSPSEAINTPPIPTLVLNVTTIPEPSSVGLFCLAVAAVVWSKRGSIRDLVNTAGGS